MPHERRRHVRKPVKLDAVILVEGSDERHEAHVHDLSVGGAYVETELELPFGTKVVLEVTFPEGKHALPATKRWDKPGGMGLQFGSLKVAQTYAVTTHIAVLEPSPDSRAL